MTRSKLEFATILATLRKLGEDPEQLAATMSLRKLCYEIEIVESNLEAQPEPPAKVKSLWDRIAASFDSYSD